MQFLGGKGRCEFMAKNVCVQRGRPARAHAHTHTRRARRRCQRLGGAPLRVRPLVAGALSDGAPRTTNVLAQRTRAKLAGWGANDVRGHATP